ncbi:MFS transporter [Campylobacter sp. MIT 99-7217]|uniref:MFS transporter n=1 Tax=Campylobacter sp. MIT 99-7217 TaxID=535091 RepID=UPI00115865DB|nr:MFS transporter [Campylobacter sp. MIT 99-7217]TQR31910.1 MFS transporter [Campylobacter sp. MIT 99-7217]
MNTFNKTLFILWFGVFTTSMGLSQLAPILPIYIRELGVSEYDQIAFYSGLSFGILSFFMAFFAPIWGMLTNKFGCKIMLLRASLGLSVLTFLLAFVQNVEQIIILRALTGILSGFVSTAVIFVALITPKDKAAQALATLSTASVSGNLIGPLFGGLVFEFIGSRGSFIFIAFLTFCSFLTILFFINEKKITQTKDLKKLKFKENIVLILILFALTFIIQAGFNSVMPIMTLFVEQIHHSDTYIAFYTGLVVAASGLSNLAFATKIGKIADIKGADKIIVISLIFCGIIFYLQSLATNIYILILLRLLLGIALGGLTPCISALFKKNVSPARLGLVFGFNQSAFAMGNFIGSVGGGYLTAKFNIETLFSFVALVFICSALMFFVLDKKFMKI